MEIYPNKEIYGIKCIRDDGYDFIKLFEKKYEKEMTIEELKKVNELLKNVADINQCTLYIYCSYCKGDSKLYFMWFEYEKNINEFFGQFF
jgi:uncharacterized protein YeaO (DUF488 family)